ncbi:MAG: hypothetical protein KTR30_16840 [Saprospiraceae bacterium]|nr:hypothetical protein [Saprospiraceae bacterium]
MKTSLLFILIVACWSCQDNSGSEEANERPKSQHGLTFEQVADSLPLFKLPLRVGKSLLDKYEGKKLNLQFPSTTSAGLEPKKVVALGRVQGFSTTMLLLYCAYPMDSEVDDYDQMLLVSYLDSGELATHLVLDVGGTGFASTQNWIKGDGEILTAVIAEMEEVEVKVKAYQFKDGEFVESGQFSKIFQDGAYQQYLEDLVKK